MTSHGGSQLGLLIFAVLFYIPKLVGVHMRYMSPLDEPNEFFLQLFLPSCLFQIVHTAQIVNNITSLPEIDL